MTVATLTGGSLQNTVIEKNLKVRPLVATLAGTLTLTTEHPPLIVVDPGGAGRTVLLPAEASSLGLTFIIKNTADAAEDLTVKEDSNTTTIGTVSQNEAAFFFCDGVTWYALVGGIT